MTRERATEFPAPLFELVLAEGDGAPSPEEKEQIMRTIRGASNGNGSELDRAMLAELSKRTKGLMRAKAGLEQTRQIVDRLTATPWHPAIFVESVMTAQGPQAMVVHGSARRVVGLANDIEVSALTAGEEVYLSQELNVVMARSAYGLPRWGEIATFQRRTPDGRLVLQRRGDEEVIVGAAEPLRGLELQPGDLIRWHRDFWMAFEKVPAAEDHRFHVEDVQDIGPEQVGGQDANLDLLLSTLTATLVAPELAALYGLSGRQSILLVGPPGCGKTLMARVVAATIKKTSGKRVYLAVVQPGEFEDPYVGVTQAKIRACFHALNQAAKDGFGLLFFDEIESIGRIRGGMNSHLADKFLAALLAELDGFERRSNVAVIAATNRKDLLDPALLERLTDVEISVKRPDMRGARAIFDIHLPEAPIYRSNGTTGNAVRQEMIETAVTRFYTPNGDNELCVLRFRDGRTRTVAARDLASGRCFEQICRSACRTAMLRQIRGGEQGVCVADIEGAVSDVFERLATTLSPRNAHMYLSGLPQDVDVVSVEPIVRRVTQPATYFNLD